MLITVPVALLIVVILFMPGATLAGQLVITSLPDTVMQSQHSPDAWDTVTFQGTKLTSSVGGFLLSGSASSPPRNWLVDLGSDTIVFGTGDGNGLYGVRVYGGSATRLPRDIIIRGGTIIHNPSTNSDTTIANGCTCMRVSGNDILIKDVNMVAGGYNGKCLTGGDYDIEVDGGTYTSNVDYYRSRCNFDAIMIALDGTWDPVFAADSGHTYNIKIHNVKLLNTPHAGIRCDGGAGSEMGIFKIYACSVLVDAHNFKYTSYSGLCFSSSNPYGLAIQHAGAGSEFYDNVITSGTTYGGGRGMLFENCSGTADNRVKIYNNLIDIHEGPNAEYDENHMETHALRIRNDCQYLRVYNNTVIGSGDANTGTSSYGRSIAAIRYTFEGTYGGVNSNNLIENNIFRVKSLTSNVNAYAVCFDAVLISRHDSRVPVQSDRG